jgi:hypothetical protein
MIKKNTWIVFILMIVVVAGFIALEKTNSMNFMTAKSSPTNTPLPSLVTLSVDSIEKIEFTAKGATAIELTKAQDGTWQTDNRSKTIAANDLQTFVNAFNTAQTNSVISLDLDETATGLKDPEYKFVFNYSNGSQQIVKFGDKNPTQVGYYARVDMGQILIVNQDSVENIVNSFNSAYSTPTPTAAETTATESAATPTPESTETATQSTTVEVTASSSK